MIARPTDLHSRCRKAIIGAPLLTWLGTLAVAGLGAGSASAAEPLAKVQAPGFFRFTLGDFEITALNDGTFDMPVDKLLKGAPAAKIDQTMAKAFLKVPMEDSLNAYLINTGAKLVLVDAGADGLFGPTLGKVVANLKASGYQPEQVDEIYITHMHVDHVGGLTSGGKLVFPNATLRADKADSDFWLSQANLDKAPADMKAFFQGAMASVNPWIKAGKYKPFEGAADLGPGIKALATKGHTPGHTSYLVESQGQKLLLTGDLIHVGAIQFEEPSVTIAFDGDPKAAQAERKKIFAEAAKGGYVLGVAHLSFPGLGHVRIKGKGFEWLPLNYTQPR
jgi:glyoxylase-like metal-dependent hydrolase (beta-lactamase superfamily II)